jgi:hypothetical protein
LTNAGSAGGLGTYELSGLSVPGVYSLEFSADGYQTETRAVEFLDAAVTPVEPINMILRVTTVKGVVVGPDEDGLIAGLEGVTVELSDGLNIRQTLTSTFPAGALFKLMCGPAKSWISVIRSCNSSKLGRSSDR